MLGELVEALQQDGQHARAVTVLEEHESVMGWVHRYQYVCNALMAGWPDKAREMFRQLVVPVDAKWIPARERVRHMLARAGVMRGVTPLDGAAARLVRGGRRRTLKIAANWPWTKDLTTAWQRIHAHPAPRLTSWNPSQRAGRPTPGTVESPAPGPTVGPASYPGPKSGTRTHQTTASGSHQPPERSG